MNIIYLLSNSESVSTLYFIALQMINQLEEFQRLIHPISVETFFSDYYEKNFLYINNREKNYYDKVLTLEDIDDTLFIKRIPPRFAKMVSLQHLSFDNWSKLDRKTGINIDLDKIGEQLREGNSLILNGLQNYIPKLNRFSQQITKELQTNNWCNVYITPSASQAFIRHYDDHDVFILQIEGQKLWKISEALIELPDRTQHHKHMGFDLDALTPTHEILLSPGDLLYLPRGVVHEAVATDTMSIHITLGVTPPRVIDLVNTFTHQLMKDDAFFRKSLLLPFNKNVQEKEAVLKSKLMRIKS